METKIEQLIVTAVIAGLGALALAAKGLDAANSWVQRKEVEKL